MSGDNSSDGFFKTRPALADVTNQHAKRAFSMISGNSAIQSADRYDKNVDVKGGDSQYAKQICLGVENLVMEKCRSKSGISSSEKGLPPSKSKQSCESPFVCSEADSQREIITSVFSNIFNEIKKPSNLSSGSLLVRDDMTMQSVVEVGDASRDSCVSSVLMPTGSGPCDGDLNGGVISCQEDSGRVTSGGSHGNLAREAFATNICKNDDKDHGLANVSSTKCGSTECSRLAKSHTYKFFELERCTGLKGDGSSSSSEGVDLLKACSCSFCLKAAYILSDLHYQDIKGRIAAIKKSQKEVSNLVQRCCEDKETKSHSRANSNKSSKLESDLMDQWRSLFLHMDDVFVREGSQLQASYLTLKDLRDNCKMNLEMINGMPLDKQ